MKVRGTGSNQAEKKLYPNFDSHIEPKMKIELKNVLEVEGVLCTDGSETNNNK